MPFPGSCLCLCLGFYYMEQWSLPAVCVYGLCFPLLFFFLALSLIVELNTLTVTIIAALYELSSEGIALSHFLYEASLLHFYPHTNNFLSESNN